MSVYRKYIISLLIILFLSGCSLFPVIKQDKSVYDVSHKAESIEVDTDDNGAIDVTYGGTNSTSASGARSNLGLVIDTDVLSPTTAASTYSDLSHASRHNLGGADEINQMCEGATIQTFTDTASPDVSNGGTGIYHCWQVYAGTPSQPVTDFDDGDDHSEFTSKDWFWLLYNNATEVDCSDNANIECNANVDFTGSSSQKLWVLWIYDGSQWVSPTLIQGLSTPTNIAVSSVQASMVWGTEITGSGSISVANMNKVYLVSAAVTSTLPAFSDCIAAGSSAAPWIKFRIQDAAETLTIDCDASDKINRSGTAQAVGVTITTSGAGTTVTCTGSTNVDGTGTDGWFCDSNGTLSQGS